MNGKRAKAIRRIVYGDFSHKDKQYITDASGTVRCIGRRRIYQEAKRNIK